MRTRMSAGMTIVEAVIGLAMLSAITAALFQLVAQHLHYLSRQEASVERRQEGRAALAALTRELQLAGFPSRPDPVCHAAGGVAADGTAVRFFANLHGVATILARAASAGETTLQVLTNEQIRDEGRVASQGAAFAANDVIYLHDPGRAGDPFDDRMECHRLERAGRSGLITLASGDAVRRAFSVGDRVEVINAVQYAYAPSSRQLMRSVDGSAQSVADRLNGIRFDGRPGRVVATLLFESGPAWQAVAAERNSVSLFDDGSP